VITCRPAVLRARRPRQHAAAVTAIAERRAARSERRAVAERGGEREHTAARVVPAHRDLQHLADRAAPARHGIERRQLQTRDRGGRLINIVYVIDLCVVMFFCVGDFLFVLFGLGVGGVCVGGVGGGGGEKEKFFFFFFFFFLFFCFV
jgi:hypothetical protein